MKTRKYLIVGVVLFVLVAAGLLAQASMSDAQDQRGLCIQEAFPNGKITDRHAFVVGALFAQQEIRQMRYKKILDAPCGQEDLLAGLKGVRVSVEDVNPKAEEYGLTRQLLRTDTELRLRQHGIRVLTNEEVMKDSARRTVEQGEKDLETLKPKVLSLMESAAGNDSDEHFLGCLREVIQHYQQQVSTPQPPYLYINVNAGVFEESGRAVFSVDVELRESADLCRNGAFCQAAIWQEGSLAGCSSRHLKEYAREYLRDKVDEFINDYLAANPARSDFDKDDGRPTEGQNGN